MADRQVRRTTGRTNTANAYRGGYIHGTAVRKTEVRPQIEKPKKQLSHTTRKNRDRANHMNLAYVLFLSVAMAVTAIALIGYIQMQSNITTSVKRFASLESQVNNLKLKNDEALNRVESSIDLEEIRRIAITELGMTYAGEGQIVQVPDDGSDYVRLYQDIEK